MKEIIKNIKLIFIDTKAKLTSGRKKTRGQSFVEFALLLPVLVLLLLIMVELGFALNAYLSVLDATRQTARYFSGQNPFIKVIDTSTDPDTITKEDRDAFYNGPLSAGVMLIDTLDANSYQIEFDTDEDAPDNIFVSVIGVAIHEPGDPEEISIIRHPEGAVFWTYDETRITADRDSKYADDDVIRGYLTQGSNTPVWTGLLIVEVYYGYESALKIPDFFFASFGTEENPFIMYASSIMPIGSAKPQPTATPSSP